MSRIARASLPFDYYKLLDQVEAGEFSDITFAMLNFNKPIAVRQLAESGSTARFLERSLARSNGWDYANNYSPFSGHGHCFVQTTLGDCKDNSIATLIGPEELLVAQLTEAGIPHEVIDWKQRLRHARSDGSERGQEGCQTSEGRKKGEKTGGKAEKKAAK